MDQFLHFSHPIDNEYYADNKSSAGIRVCHLINWFQSILFMIYVVAYEIRIFTFTIKFSRLEVSA